MTDAPKLDPATAASLGSIFAELAHNPKTRKIVAKAVREGMPGSREALSFSDVAQEEAFESFKAEQEKREIERQQEAILARMNAQRSRLLNGDESGRKYTEDDVQKIESLMKSKGITDYDDGRVLYQATLPPDNPKPGHDIPEVHGTTWDFPEWAKFAKDPQRASRETANQVITELMQARRR